MSEQQSAPISVRPRISVEFFPPKAADGLQKLVGVAQRLSSLSPDFFSVTYGAGGTTQDGTLEALSAISAATRVPVAGHLTCVGASRGEVDDVARQYMDRGVSRIVALRGDAPEGSDGFQPHPQGYARAAELVAGLMKVGDFDLSVAAYPEVHPDAKTAQADLDNLKAKLDAGAKRAITQYFFEPETFLRFRDRAVAAGITQPILPGIMPIRNLQQIRRFSEGCGTNVPDWLDNFFAGSEDHIQDKRMLAAIQGAALCRDLFREGVHEFHFYCLNQADLTLAIARSLIAGTDTSVEMNNVLDGGGSPDLEESA